MTRTAFCVWLAFLSTGATMFARQDTAVFTGRWILANPAVAPATVAPELQVGETNGAFPRVLTVERRLASGLRSDRYTVGLAGGTVGGVDANGRGTGPNGQQPTTRFRVAWEGAVLVMEEERYSGLTRNAGPFTERREAWSLDSAGRLLVEISERSSSADPVSTRLIYRRP